MLGSKYRGKGAGGVLLTTGMLMCSSARSANTARGGSRSRQSTWLQDTCSQAMKRAGGRRTQDVTFNGRPRQQRGCPGDVSSRGSQVLDVGASADKPTTALVVLASLAWPYQTNDGQRVPLHWTRYLAFAEDDNDDHSTPSQHWSSPAKASQPLSTVSRPAYHPRGCS